MGAVLDLAGKLLYLSYEGNKALVGMKPDRGLAFQQVEDSEGEVITTYSSNDEKEGDEHDPGEDLDSKEKYVVLEKEDPILPIPESTNSSDEK